jgi:hypothetical protein
MNGLLFAADQFRMRRLQVFHWGPFTGLHDIPIAETIVPPPSEPDEEDAS